MDEQTWLSSTEADALLSHLHSDRNAARTKAGRRKLRLFMAGCFRPVWDLLDERAHAIVEAAETAADAAKPGANRLPSFDEAFEFWRQSGWFTEQGFRLHSCHALLHLIQWYGSPSHGARGVSSYLCLAQSYPKPPLSVKHSAYDKTQEVTRSRHAELVREIFGNPFRPLPKQKFPAEIVGLAQTCYDDRAHYPVLADALDDLGESEAAAHCRQSGHVKGCHVVDWVLGQA